MNSKSVLHFWFPLALTWVMMSVEGPLLAALIARLADPKFNLAAYGVAFSLAMLIEAPIIMLISAAAALVKGRESLHTLSQFTFVMNVVITAIMLILVLPHNFYFIAHSLIGLPQEVSHLAYGTQLLLIPWPAAIGIRRFYQGILVVRNGSKRIVYGTVVRMTSMAAVAIVAFQLHCIPGAFVGGLALSVGVCCEAIASRIMVHSILKQLRTEGDPPEALKLTFWGVARFYAPLAMTSVLGLGIQPIITFFMGQSRASIESLAVLPVINSFAFFFRSMGWSYLEVVISLMGQKKADYPAIRSAAYTIGIASTCVYGLVVLSPLSYGWYHTVSGLSNELTAFALTPARLLILLPLMEPLISIQRGIMILTKKTIHTTTATVLELATLITALFIGVGWVSLAGATIAVSAQFLARLSAFLYLLYPCNRPIKERYFFSPGEIPGQCLKYPEPESVGITGAE
ncbi:MAG: hypothetical protein JW795_09440 [Chitinivibrionales bacterium]|nr:hypothetical protein [Chitinivibrionales bacterium]